MKSGTKRRKWIAWCLLLLLASALRLPAPAWDGGIAAHPDERFLVGVAEATPLWGDPNAVSPDFPYGHLPVYVLRLLIIAAPGRDALFAARLLSGLIGVLWVVVTGVLGACLLGESGGLVSAALIAVAPFPLQQARFYTVDPLGTVLISLAVVAVLRRRWLGAGVLLGLAVACKASLAWGGGALLFAVWEHHRTRSRVRFLKSSPLRSEVWTVIRDVCNVLAGAGGAFVLASPWAVLRPAVAWRAVLIQAGMASGRYDFPYTRQYAGTLPFVYPLTQLALWGIGPIALLLAGAGLGWVWLRWRRGTFRKRVVWIWTVSFFLATAGWFVKFPRYLLPVYPALAAWAVWGLTGVNRLWRFSRFRRMLGYGLAALLVVSTGTLGCAQLSIYGAPHPWVQASRWIYGTLLPGEQIAIEHWDHALPAPLPDLPEHRFEVMTLPVLDEASAAQREALEEAAAMADLIIVASRRGYGALARSPDKYSETLAWYAHLFASRHPVMFQRCPRVGPVAITDDPLADAGLDSGTSLAVRCGARYAVRFPRLDESFRVYDAPLVVLFPKP
ncbi:MAG: glycosyltransferase family 39 protein [Anaerolineae bacterium]|nr:glycosyltransferase family 39 protein [Anaerolineae bacterium]